MATMVDVARMAGVSISTVSHVLNGTRNVEPKTRGRVLSAIEMTGYRQTRWPGLCAAPKPTASGLWCLTPASRPSPRWRTVSSRPPPIGA